LLLGIERAAGDAGYRLSITNVRDLAPASIEAASRRFADQSVDGIILIEPVYSAGKAFMGSRVPVLALGRASRRGLPSVAPDNVAAAEMVVHHLLSLGHRTVWHVGGPEHWTAADDRVKGWRAALEEAGCSVPPFERGDWTPRSGFEIGRRLAANQDATAIFVGNDQMAVGVLRALDVAGRRVPDDVSVVGIDDIPEAEFLSPPLTTVRQDLGLVAHVALEMLLEMVNGAPSIARHRTIQSSLITRESTAPRPRRIPRVPRSAVKRRDGLGTGTPPERIPSHAQS
jgi:DNA-binding LacI/PurR family transcriptional regulator